MAERTADRLHPQRRTDLSVSSTEHASNGLPEHGVVGEVELATSSMDGSAFDTILRGNYQIWRSGHGGSVTVRGGVLKPVRAAPRIRREQLLLCISYPYELREIGVLSSDAHMKTTEYNGVGSVYSIRCRFMEDLSFVSRPRGMFSAIRAQLHNFQTHNHKHRFDDE